MSYHYSFARLPRDPQLAADIEQAAGRLAAKLQRLNVQELDISDPNKRYFGKHLTNAHNALGKFAYLLSWVLADRDVALDRFVFVDYGGGDGIFSLLAKELGIGTVIYADIYEPSCRDARVIARALGNEAEHYVNGDIGVLLDFVRSHSLAPHGLGSYDVIEHIYDIEGFLGKLAGLSAGSLTVVLASGANPRNFRIRRQLMEFQRKAEHGGRKAEWGYKPTYCTTAYVLIRKELIQQHAPGLSNGEVDRLVKVTRGKMAADIRQIVDAYRETGKMPVEPSHPTNTCNPHDGNWCERLMEPAWLRDVLVSAGFDAQVLGGYYSSSAKDGLLKRTAGALLNPAITLLGQAGLALSPFYTLHARRPGHRGGI